MLKKVLYTLGIISVIGAVLFVTGCQAKEVAAEEVKEEVVVVQPESTILNVYTDRHYDTDTALYEKFTAETGIEVNIVKAKSDEIIERLDREGADTEADVLIVTDAGRLHRAKEKELLAPVETEKLSSNVPANLRDKDNLWHALTVRARVYVYALDRVNPEDIKEYSDLTKPEFAGKVLVRSSSNLYNQSLLASFIEIGGEEKAKEWAAGIVDNMAREPKGNDRDQAKAVVAGEGDVAIMNTYYLGKLLNSDDAEEVKVGQQVGVVFPSSETEGTHVNVSGIALTKYAKNTENAVKLMEFLTGEVAQGDYANANYEYPVNPNVEPAELLKSWGEFNAQDINLSVLGENNQRAVEVLGEVNWK